MGGVFWAPLALAPGPLGAGPGCRGHWGVRVSAREWGAAQTNPEHPLPANPPRKPSPQTPAPPAPKPHPPTPKALRTQLPNLPKRGGSEAFSFPPSPAPFWEREAPQPTPLPGKKAPSRFPPPNGAAPLGQPLPTTTSPAGVGAGLCRRGPTAG